MKKNIDRLSLVWSKKFLHFGLSQICQIFAQLDEEEISKFRLIRKIWMFNIYIYIFFFSGKKMNFVLWLEERISSDLPLFPPRQIAMFSLRRSIIYACTWINTTHRPCRLWALPCLSPLLSNYFIGFTECESFPLCGDSVCVCVKGRGRERERV